MIKSEIIHLQEFSRGLDNSADAAWCCKQSDSYLIKNEENHW